MTKKKKIEVKTVEDIKKLEKKNRQSGKSQQSLGFLIK